MRVRRRGTEGKENGPCVSWPPLSLWCSPGYSSITQSTVHDWLAEREREKGEGGERVSERVCVCRVTHASAYTHMAFLTIALEQMGKVMNAALG